MLPRILVLLMVLAIVACHGPTVFTAGETESGYTYVPVDPFPVVSNPGSHCASADDMDKTPLLFSLPDNAVRMLVEQFDATGAVTYGAAKVGLSGQSYRITIDYINADTINKRIWISKSLTQVRHDGGLDKRTIPVAVMPDFDYLPGSEEYKILTDEAEIPEGRDNDYAEFNIPVYVGIGLRIAAHVTVTGSKANISGLGVIGAEAEDNNLKGSLMVQTLGVNGKSVAAALPIQSELNRTTAQNAIVAVGSIKALLYSDETVVSPRVVGLYLPFPGGKPLVNALVSQLSRQPIPWSRACKKTMT
jgi:hypothetical protein